VTAGLVAGVGAPDVEPPDVGAVPADDGDAVDPPVELLDEQALSRATARLPPPRPRTTWRRDGQDGCEGAPIARP
jgi:hypothetical protein